MSNAVLLSGLCGGLLGCLIGLSHEWGIGNDWQRLSVLIVLWVPVAIIITTVFGRWRAHDNPPMDSGQVRKWRRVSIAAVVMQFAILLAFGGYTQLQLRYWSSIEKSRDFRPAADAMDTVERFFVLAFAALALSIALGVFGAWAYAKSHRARFSKQPARQG